MASIPTNLTKNALKDLQFYHKSAVFNYPESHNNIICIFTQICLSEVRHTLNIVISGKRCCLQKNAMIRAVLFGVFIL